MIYEQADDAAWGAYLPDLPGVVAIGKTRAEVGERIKDCVNWVNSVDGWSALASTTGELPPG